VDTGAAQPFADVFKLMFKEIVIPADASGFLFRWPRSWP